MEYHLSYSKLQCFEQCPLKYKFQYIEKKPAKTGKALFLGMTTHAAISEYLKNSHVGKESNTSDYESCENQFREAWRVSKRKALSQNDFPFTKDEEIVAGKTGIAMMKNFVESQYNKTPHWNEQMVNVTILRGEVVFWGKIDRVDLTDGAYSIVDYKTGSYKEKYLDRFQLRVYAWFVRKHGLTPIISTSYYYLEPNVIVEFPASPEMAEETENEIETRCTNIIKALSTRELKPTPSKLCPWCEYVNLCPAKHLGGKIE